MAGLPADPLDGKAAAPHCSRLPPVGKPPAPMFSLIDLGDIAFQVSLATIVLAGLVRGFSGFGAAMIIVPPLSAVYSPAFAIPIMLLVDNMATLPLVVRTWPRIRWRDVLPLSIAAIAGVPLGLQILLWADPEVLRWAMAGVILLAVLAMASGWRYARRPTMATSVATGASAGVLTGSVGIGGPPIVLFWLAGQDNVGQVRANIIGAFFLIGLSTFSTFFLSGLITAPAFGLSLTLVPFYAAAVWLGARLFRVASERFFRTLALILVAAIAVVSALA